MRLDSSVTSSFLLLKVTEVVYMDILFVVDYVKSYGWILSNLGSIDHGRNDLQANLKASSEPQSTS